MARFRDNFDRPLVLSWLWIAVLGAYNLSSAGRPISPNFVWGHVAHLILGVVVAIAVSIVHYRRFQSIGPAFFVLAIVLLLVTNVSGKVVNGSRRWLELGPITLQTSDLAKLAVVFALASILKQEKFDGKGITLWEIFRPFNFSRPVIVLLGVLTILVLGDSFKSPTVEVYNGHRFRPAARLSDERPEVILGRYKNKEVQIGINHAGVADKHITILRKGSRKYFLKVLALEEPTYLNNALVKGEIPLRDGDEVRLGGNDRARIKFKSLTAKLWRRLPLFTVLGVFWIVTSVIVFRRQKRHGFRDWIAPIDVIAIPSALVMLQPDLGTSIILGLVGFTMIFYAGMERRSFIVLASLSVLGSVVAWFGLLASYQQERILNFLNPEQDLAGAGYHQHQSLIAIGSGRLFGKGHGQGTQTQFSFLPEQQTDFVFPVWAEEHGFLGAALAVLGFLVLSLLMIRVAQRAWDRYGSLLAIGMGSVIFWHAFINLMMVLRLAPVVGVPLPFWSAGGSFIITCMIALGIVFNVSLRRSIF